MIRFNPDPCDGIPGAEIIKAPHETRSLYYSIKHNGTFHAILISVLGSVINCLTHGKRCTIIDAIRTVYVAREAAERIEGIR